MDVFETNILLSTLLLFIISIWYFWKISKVKYNLPPGPKGVPILGYLPYLGKEPFKTLDNLANSYGNVFRIKLGLSDVIILGDNEAVKDAFSKSETTDRPPKLFDFLPDGVGISSINGSEWVEQRKFCLKSMRELGLGKSKWEAVLQDEVDDFVNVISSYNGAKIEISQALTSSVSNNISSFVFGKRFASNHPDRIFLNDILDEILLSFGQDNIFNFFPTLRDICIALGIGESAKTHEKFEKFNNFIREEVRKIKESDQLSHVECGNFITDYLKETDNLKGKTGHYFNDTNLIGNIQALFIGGSDTTTTSIYWLLLILASYPEIQAKLHEEIDLNLNKKEKIQWSERNKIPYTYATILEGQRWRTIAPLNTARLATKDIKIQGYDIPKGTTIIANNWGLHNDKKYWRSPEIFDPKRFLNEDGKLIQKPESYFPFSYGKRNCPAETIAFMEILVYIVTLMQNFKILPAEKELVMDGELGLTYHPIKQHLHFIRRT